MTHLKGSSIFSKKSEKNEIVFDIGHKSRLFCVSPFRIIVTFSGCCYCQEYTYFCANSGSNQEASLSR